MATHYVETSIPSYYFEVRPELAILAETIPLSGWPLRHHHHYENGPVMAATGLP